MKDFLIERLKQLIVDCLDLEDTDAASIPDDAPIFGGAMGLDSIDALELVLQIEKIYGVKIKSSEETRVALSSVAVLADYILERAPDKVAAQKAAASAA